MKHRSPRHYARLLAAQKLLKTRDETELAGLKRDLIVLEEENTMLATMLTQGSYADFVDPLLISQRMERNRQGQTRLTVEIETQIKSWLQSKRRVDHLTEKQAQAKTDETRAQLADLLGESVAHSFTSQQSLRKD